MHTPRAADAVTFVRDALHHASRVYQRAIPAYVQAWRVSCVLADIDGRIVAGEALCREACAEGAACAAARTRAIEESVRWGEPSAFLCPQAYLIWAVPIMENMRVVGGLIAAQVDIGTVTEETADTLSPRQIRQAMEALLALAIRENLTNPAFLARRTLEAQRESAHADAIHALKAYSGFSWRELYLTEEPALIAAIKAGERDTARAILNRLLTRLYDRGGARAELLKSYLLELVVMMARSAVEAGAEPAKVLGTHYSAVTALAQIDEEEALCHWLVEMLERLMDAITVEPGSPIDVIVNRALTYMQAHLQDDLSRDAVARVAQLSPSSFSRAVKHHFGASFTELLTRMRVARARDLLTYSEKSLLQICMDCGFSTQRYFTTVFQKATGQPPGEYRRATRRMR